MKFWLNNQLWIAEKLSLAKSGDLRAVTSLRSLMKNAAKHSTPEDLIKLVESGFKIRKKAKT